MKDPIWLTNMYRFGYNKKIYPKKLIYKNVDR